MWASFNLLFSLTMFFKTSTSVALLCCMGTLINCMMMWWLSYSEEYGLAGSNTSGLEAGLKVSMLLFISSEVWFFFSFFWSYFHFFLNPNFELGSIFPAPQLLPFDPFNVPMVNTIVLLLSGVTVTLSHHFLLSKQKNLQKSSLLVTVALGLLFSVLQLEEYNSSFFSISDSVFGTTFFILTGFHGLHVLVGTIFMLVTTTRITKMVSNFTEVSSFDLAAWYWHFVDVVWIFLYFSLYYLNN